MVRNARVLPQADWTSSGSRVSCSALLGSDLLEPLPRKVESRHSEDRSSANYEHPVPEPEDRSPNHYEIPGETVRQLGTFSMRTPEAVGDVVMNVRDRG